MSQSPPFAYLYDKNAPASTVLLHEKRQTAWRCTSEWPEPFACAVTGLKYYANTPCYTCAELPGVLISMEGIARLRTKAFSFLR